MSKNRDINLYIKDIKTCIKNIENYTKNLSFEKFKKSDMVIDAVIRNIEVIGEAVSNIPKEFRDKYPDIPWKKIVGMRNKMIHEYFGVDFEILWKAVRQDILELKRKIKEL